MLAEGPSGLRVWQSRDSSGKDGAVAGPSSLREGHQSAGCQFVPWALAELWDLCSRQRGEGVRRVQSSAFARHRAGAASKPPACCGR